MTVRAWCQTCKRILYSGKNIYRATTAKRDHVIENFGTAHRVLVGLDASLRESKQPANVRRLEHRDEALEAALQAKGVRD